MAGNEIQLDNDRRVVDCTGCQHPFRMYYLCSVVGRAFYCSAGENFFQCTGKIPTLHCSKFSSPIYYSASTCGILPTDYVIYVALLNKKKGFY